MGEASSDKSEVDQVRGKESATPLVNKKNINGKPN